MARFRKGDVKLKTSQKVTLGDSDEGTIQYDTDAIKLGGGVKLDSGIAVNEISDNSASDSTSALMTTEAIQSNISNVEQLIADKPHPAFLSTPEEIILNSTKGIKGLLGIENIELTEESSFNLTSTSGVVRVQALPNGNIATLIHDAADDSILDIYTLDGTQVTTYTVIAAESDAGARLEVLQSGHIVVAYISGNQGKFQVFNQDGDLLVAETTPVTSEGGYVTTDPANIQPLAGGKFMFYGSQFNVVARIAIYEMDGGSLSTIKQLFDVTETSGVTNIEESDLLADGNIVFSGYNNVIAGRALMIVDQNGVEVLQAVNISVESTDLQIKNLPSKRIAAFVKIGGGAWIQIYDYELNLINSLKLGDNNPSVPYSIEVLQNGSIAVGFGDGVAKQNLVYILDENLNIEQSIVVSTSSTAASYMHMSAMYTGGFVAIDYINSNSNNIRIFTSSKTRINGSLGLAAGEYVNEISNSPASDSTSAIMTTEAIQALADVAGLFTEDVNNNIVGGTDAGTELSSGVDNFFAGVTAGRYGDGSYNVAIGTQALEGVTANSFSNNVAIGHQTAYAVTTAADSVIIGYRAGYGINSGASNVYIGRETANFNKTGGSNVFIGYRAGYGVTAENNSNNTFIGYSAGRGITGGNNNTFIGYNSGYAVKSGSSNVFIGYQAGRYTETGGSNVVIGGQAGFGASAQNYANNVFVGYQSAFSITTGGNNCIIGYHASRYNQTGAENTVFGYQAGLGVTDNSYTGNTLVGYAAGWSLLTGGYNVVIGWQAGKDMEVGSYNIIIGHDINPTDSTGDYQFMLGSAAYPFLRGDMASYALGINGPDGYLNFGSDGTTVGEALGITGYGIRDNSGVMEYKDFGGSWTTFASLSDIRLKENIKDYNLGLDFISKLNTKRFNFKNKPKETEEGLIAQEVKGVLDDLDVEFSGWKERPDGLQELKYNKFVIPLINAVQEQKEEIEKLKEQINELRQNR